MFCTKCGQEIADGSTFCTFCGSRMSATGTMSGSSMADYSSKIEWQPPVRPARKGIPGWGWVLIGCGGLFLISLIGIGIAGYTVSKKMAQEFGGLDNVQVVGELTIVQGGLHTYKENKGKFGDFEALKDEGVLTGLTYDSLEKFKIETKIGTYELLLPDDGAHFKLIGTAKIGGKKWELDENSGTLFDDMFGVDTSGALSAPSSGS